MRASTVLVALAPLAVMQVHAMGFLTLDDPKPKDCSACSKLAMPGNRSKCARICSETPTITQGNLMTSVSYADASINTAANMRSSQAQKQLHERQVPPEARRPESKEVDDEAWGMRCFERCGNTLPLCFPRCMGVEPKDWQPMHAAEACHVLCPRFKAGRNCEIGCMEDLKHFSELASKPWAEAASSTIVSGGPDDKNNLQKRALPGKKTGAAHPAPTKYASVTKHASATKHASSTKHKFAQTMLCSNSTARSTVFHDGNGIKRTAGCWTGFPTTIDSTSPATITSAFTPTILCADEHARSATVAINSGSTLTVACLPPNSLPTSIVTDTSKPEDGKPEIHIGDDHHFHFHKDDAEESDKADHEAEHGEEGDGDGDEGDEGDKEEGEEEEETGPITAVSETDTIHLWTIESTKTVVSVQSTFTEKSIMTTAPRVNVAATTIKRAGSIEGSVWSFVVFPLLVGGIIGAWFGVL